MLDEHLISKQILNHNIIMLIRFSLRPCILDKYSIQRYYCMYIVNYCFVLQLNLEIHANTNFIRFHKPSTSFSPHLPLNWKVTITLTRFVLIIRFSPKVICWHYKLFQLIQRIIFRLPSHIHTKLYGLYTFDELFSVRPKFIKFDNYDVYDFCYSTLYINIKTIITRN